MIAPHAIQHHARKAGPVWCAILALFRTPALTMPWHKVYIHPEHWERLDIRLHEAVHLRQIRRDGALVFTWRYLRGLITPGYWDMPYEIEARAAHE